MTTGLVIHLKISLCEIWIYTKYINMARGKSSSVKRKWQKQAYRPPTKAKRVFQRRNPLSGLKSAGWNTNITQKRNYEIVGLQLDPNHDMKKGFKSQNLKLVKSLRKRNLGNELLEAVDTMGNLTSYGQTAKLKPTYFLTEDEERYIRVFFNIYFML